VDLLPEMDVVEGDPFNSSPTDPKLMGPDVLTRWRRGEKLPATTARTPLVRTLPGGAVACATAAAPGGAFEGGWPERMAP
jgi:magnesium chelatase subunit I